MDDVFAALRARVDLPDVAQRAGLSLLRRGSRLWACCPLHSERTPSFVIYDDGRWYCHGCHAGGDAVDLVARMRGIGPLDAARWLDATYNLHLFDSQPNAAEVHRRVDAAKAEQARLDAFGTWALRAGNVLAAYLQALDALKRDLEPQGPDGEIPAIFGWVCRELDRWEAVYLEVFVCGGFREQVQLFKDHGREVDTVDRALVAFGQG